MEATNKRAIAFNITLGVLALITLAVWVYNYIWIAQALKGL